MYNLHLLQKIFAVEEYENLDMSPPYWPGKKRLPSYLIARCPFCLTEYVEKLDTYTIQNWKRRVTTTSTFVSNIAGSNCEHQALTQTFFDFHGRRPEGLEGYSIGREKSYVIGHLLESGLCLAVIHALPVCRIDNSVFVPSYTLFIISYFSKQSRQEIIAAVQNFNAKWYSVEASGTLYLPLQYGEAHWADLHYWIAKGQLYWVDGGDPELGIRTHDVDAFPYGNLTG